MKFVDMLFKINNFFYNWTSHCVILALWVLGLFLDIGRVWFVVGVVMYVLLLAHRLLKDRGLKGKMKEMGLGQLVGLNICVVFGPLTPVLLGLLLLFAKDQKKNMKLGDWMKKKEESLRSTLPPKKWYMLRLDGKAFSKFTKGFNRPFDDKFIHAMNDVAAYLCQGIQGSKMAFVQSDEISVLFTDIGDIEKTQAWFDGAVLKIVSVSASMASAKFNQVLPTEHLALFDSRLLVLENLEEVQAYFKWRQEDCIKNSISMVASSLYSHKELDSVNSTQKLEMIKAKGKPWEEYPQGQKQGRIITKKQRAEKAVNKKTQESVDCIRSYWESDPAPILSEVDLKTLFKVSK